MKSRRDFIKQSSAAMLALGMPNVYGQPQNVKEVDAHLWVYASRFPPNWDCTPILDEVFADLKYAGYSGVEIMEPILRHDDAVDRLLGLQHKYKLALAGTSYSGDMWKKEDHEKIAEDLDLVTERLHKAGGKMIGLSVGSPGRKKTEEELDVQGELLKKILTICNKNRIEANMHNHTYEMEHDMFDFKGTVQRVPELKLGPDLNWLLRAGVDPVWFINSYGNKMVYMHIRDQRADGKWTEAVGEGDTNFNAISNAFEKINYRGKAAVELAFEPGTDPSRPVKESWKMSRQFVKKIFGW